MISLLDLPGPLPVGWPTRADLFDLAHKARASFDRRALRIVQQHVDAADWTADEELLFYTMMRLASATMALEGDEAGMLAFGRVARRFTNDVRAQALVEAVMSRAYYEAGERIAARERLETAIAHLRTVDPATVCAECWLGLADAAMPFDLDFARDAIRYSESCAIETPLEPHKPEFRTFVRGRLAEALGDADDAATHYQIAFASARATNDLRITIIIAVRLGTISGNSDAWAFVAEHAHRCDPSWWPIRLLDAHDAYVPRVTHAQREVLARVCAGQSNRTIGLETGRSISRVRDIVAELFDIFGVQPRTRAALVAVANRYDFGQHRPGRVGARLGRPIGPRISSAAPVV